MRYFIFDLTSDLQYHESGKSVNTDAMVHLDRVLYDFELFFVTEGKLYLAQKGEYVANANQIIFHQKGFRQRGTTPSCNVFYWLHLDGKITVVEDENKAREYCKKGEKRIYFPEYFSLTEPERITFLFAQLNHYVIAGGQTLMKNYLTMALFVELAEQYKKSSNAYHYDRRFTEIIYYLSARINKNVTVVELAERFSYNPKYLSRLFKKYTGMTPINFILSKRLDYASHLLLTTNESIKSVSIQVGFSDEYYFMRVFKKRFGITPKTYRNVYSGCNYT